MPVKAAFVTGGGGYVGSKLCCELARNGYSVTAFYLNFHGTEGPQNPRITNIQGDVRDAGALRDAVEQSGASVLFHIASYGMSGREQFNKKKIEDVNIRGTKNVLQVCVDCGVGAVVYTSTFNVVFGGQEILDGREEDLPYFPLDKHVDHYSRTKAIAEQAVLAANGCELAVDTGRVGVEVAGERRLRTCALRCAGIYGEGEQRHLPRIVSYMERRLFQFVYGSEDSLVEFLHGDNFVQAHIRAAEALQKHDSPVPGEAYFISDGKPINNFEFFRQLCEGLGYGYPKLRLPLPLVYCMALIIEGVHGTFGRYVYNFQPLLTRAEVYKTGVSHYFSLDKARSHFGYNPQPRDLSGVVQWFRDRGRGNTGQGLTSSRSAGLQLLALLSLSLIALVLCWVVFMS